MARKKVLVTGMNGLIGGVVRRRLEGEYDLSALNRGEVAGVPCHRADLGDLDAIRPAFEGIDCVVHMAAVVTLAANLDDVVRTNVIGTYNVFEAAHRAGVGRVVYASSGATIGNCELDEPYKAIAEGRYEEAPASWPMLGIDAPIRPKGLYGCSKVWGEALARHYADTTPLSIICLRIGGVNKDDRPRSAREYSIWCSQRDIARLVELSVQAPDDLKFDIFYGVSANRWSYRDVEHSRRVIGWAPEDSAESYR